MKHHYLKTWLEFFRAIERGEKNFEIRLNDRGFEAGDLVTLQEWNQATKEYTGKELEFLIGFVIDSEWGLQSGWCVFSLLNKDESTNER